MLTQTSLFDEYPRWTILLSKEEAEDFEETEFRVVAHQDNLFTNEFVILTIEALTIDGEYTADDILTATGAIAVHEEYTNAVLIQSYDLEDIAEDIYTWNGSGRVFLADMLTDIERLNFLMKNIYDNYKTPVSVDTLSIRLKKDEEPIPVKGNVEKLFTDDIYSVIYNDKEIHIWWADIIENRGLFLAILDEDMIDIDLDDDVKKLPAPKYTYPYDDNDDDDYDDYWDRYYNGYNYRDDYYKRY